MNNQLQLGSWFLDQPFGPLREEHRLTYPLNYVLCSEIKDLWVPVMLFSDPQNLGPFFGTQGIS